VLLAGRQVRKPSRVERVQVRREKGRRREERGMEEESGRVRYRTLVRAEVMID